MPDAPTVQVTLPADAERLDLGFVDTGVLSDGDATDGKLVVLSSRIPAGIDGPPQHVHGDMAELFHVLEGTLRIVMRDETFDVPAGGAVSVPAGVPHSYSNPFDEPAAFLTVMSDDSTLRMLRQVPALERTADGRPDATAMRDLMADCDMTPWFPAG